MTRDCQSKDDAALAALRNRTDAGMMVFCQTNRRVRGGLDIRNSAAYSLGCPAAGELGRTRVSICIATNRTCDDRRRVITAAIHARAPRPRRGTSSGSPRSCPRAPATPPLAFHSPPCVSWWSRRFFARREHLDPLGVLLLALPWASFNANLRQYSPGKRNSVNRTMPCGTANDALGGSFEGRAEKNPTSAFVEASSAIGCRVTSSQPKTATPNEARQSHSVRASMRLQFTTAVELWRRNAIPPPVHFASQLRVTLLRPGHSQYRECEPRRCV